MVRIAACLIVALAFWLEPAVSWGQSDKVSILETLESLRRDLDTEKEAHGEDVRRLSREIERLSDVVGSLQTNINQLKSDMHKSGEEREFDLGNYWDSNTMNIVKGKCKDDEFLHGVEWKMLSKNNVRTPRRIKVWCRKKSPQD